MYTKATSSKAVTARSIFSIVLTRFRMVFGLGAHGLHLDDTRACTTRSSRATWSSAARMNADQLTETDIVDRARQACKTFSISGPKKRKNGVQVGAAEKWRSL
jgi:hypothetical protein